MSEPFIGEIRMFGGSFAPRGWALCNGQLLQVSQNNLLFSLFGTFYGGDGQTTFGLPDLRGRAPMHIGTGPGLSSRHLGQKYGEEDVTVSMQEMPSHSHTISPLENEATGSAADTSDPAGNSLALANVYQTGHYPSSERYMHDDTVSVTGMTTSTGGSLSHENMSPYLAVYFIVALTGTYPSRN